MQLCDCLTLPDVFVSLSCYEVAGVMSREGIFRRKSLLTPLSLSVCFLSAKSLTPKTWLEQQDFKNMTSQNMSQKKWEFGKRHEKRVCLSESLHTYTFLSHFFSLRQLIRQVCLLESKTLTRSAFPSLLSHPRPSFVESRSGKRREERGNGKNERLYYACEEVANILRQ